MLSSIGLMARRGRVHPPSCIASSHDLMDNPHRAPHAILHLGAYEMGHSVSETVSSVFRSYFSAPLPRGWTREVEHVTVVGESRPSDLGMSHHGFSTVIPPHKGRQDERFTCRRSREFASHTQGVWRRRWQAGKGETGLAERSPSFPSASLASYSITRLALRERGDYLVESPLGRRWPLGNSLFFPSRMNLG